jgi:uncharacterized protein (DUF433 family)
MTHQNLYPTIIDDPEIHGGQPVLSGTRIPIAIIIGSLAGGMTYEEVMTEYVVTKEQILVALNCLSLLNKNGES